MALLEHAMFSVVCDQSVADTGAMSPDQRTVPPNLRGRALASWRRETAVRLATEGHSYDEIARTVGYANRGTAWRAVQQSLAESRLDAVDEHRALEMLRLDELQLSLWDKAMQGDIRAIQQALRIIEQRCRLLRLTAQDLVTDQPRGILVPPGSKESNQESNGSIRYASTTVAETASTAER